jgi:hypothetical protein
MNSPGSAIALRADEKTRIRAPGRAQHTVFPQAYPPVRQSNGCFRRGTAAPFAAPDYPAENAIWDCENRHAPEYYVKFIKKPDKECGDGKTLHTIAGNCKTHNGRPLQRVYRRTSEPVCIAFHVGAFAAPDSAERFFRETAAGRIRRESRRFADEPITAIGII